MSLKDDLAIMERHERNGTLREWFEGTAPMLPPEPWPCDPTARAKLSTPVLVRMRGD